MIAEFVCVCFAVFTLFDFTPSLYLSLFLWSEFLLLKPEISFSVPACLLSSLQASLQTTVRELQDVKFAIYLSGRLSEHMFD